MKKQITFILVAIALALNSLSAQDTFSIIAVDPETGEVGSAGATCVPGIGALGGVILLNSIIPGRGGVNAQAWICIDPHINLDNAIEQMDMGLSPQEVLDWLYDNDACFSQNFNPEYRQYGVADFSPEGEPRAAAFTGVSTDDWKGHRVGSNYAIQGNILKGPEVVDSMEAHFLAAEGSLAFKLMAAMQGANIVGADARCTAAGTSSTSAFLRVFKPDDAPDAPYLELNVAETPTGQEPIDSLQTLFDAWVVSSASELASPDHSPIHISPNPSNGQIRVTWLNPSNFREGMLLQLIHLGGSYLKRIPYNQPNLELVLEQEGVFIIQLFDREGHTLATEKVIHVK
ncbi:MAG TPA: DUF1028 domain-containing protein [Saprospiraceae bacterium]|nr:DUF1028 domain-containing protein [Saprospiraceae bacterium]HMQ84946.1 DUF1028 domain-containing protein [Saprospiraceae bacterium]